jgi:hypothetical protein
MKDDTNNVVAAPPENISHSVGRAAPIKHGMFAGWLRRPGRRHSCLR